MNPEDDRSASDPTVLRVTISPVLKMAFLAVLGITILSMILGCSMALASPNNRPPNDQVPLLVELFTSITKMGFGAIVGLLGGVAGTANRE
jgi:hypothetical protein